MGEKCGLWKMGKLLNVTRERIRQIEAVPSANPPSKRSKPDIVQSGFFI